MTISRITTWVDGNVLTAAALNAEFDNIINNALNLISPLTGNLNFNLNQATNLVFEPLGAQSFVNGRVSFYANEGLTVVETTAVGGKGQLLLSPPYTVSRVQGLRGEWAANVATFAADHGYVLERGDQGNTSEASRGVMTQVNATSAISINTQSTWSNASPGRDQSSAFTSTYVHFYGVSTGVGSTAIYGAVSSVPPPRGPFNGVTGGFVYLGSAMYTPASSAMTHPAYQVGSEVYLKSQGTLLSANGPTAGLTSSPVALATFVPPTALKTKLYANLSGVAQAAGSISAALALVPASSGGPGPTVNVSVLNGNSSQVMGIATEATLPVISNPPLMYYQVVLNSGTSASADVALVSYTVPNGDV